MNVTRNALLRTMVITIDRKELQEFIRGGTVTCTAHDGDEITISCRDLQMVTRKEEPTDDKTPEQPTDQEIPRGFQPA